MFISWDLKIANLHIGFKTQKFEVLFSVKHKY